MSNDKRRRIYVDRHIQGSLALRILVHWVAFFVVSLSLTLLFHFLSDPNGGLFTHISNVLSTHRHFLTVSVVLIPAFMYDSVQLSNRFAGPIVRFRRLIKEVGTGTNVEPLKFRDGDFWHDLSLDINAMLERLKEQELRNQQAGGAPSVRSSWDSTATSASSPAVEYNAEPVAAK